jgi:hypothetical protein
VPHSNGNRGLWSIQFDEKLALVEAVMMNAGKTRTEGAQAADISKPKRRPTKATTSEF